MNTAYDKEAAVKSLESTLKANKEDMDENGDESIQHLLALNDNNLNVTMTGGRRTIWRVSTGDAEFTFRVQGILDHAGATQIAASNKFYTNRSDDPDASKLLFSIGVDPFGYFEKVSTDQHVHSHDNTVAYFKQAKDNDSGTVLYEDVFPGNFCVGDIVSIEAALYAFQNERKRIRLHINLRAMTLIESKFSKMCNDWMVR
ncbi:hypothetical protein B0H14DRAFT_2564339 [Mycena olivaceomarginata]|nr:hypothetical protein B0H14DRAFT_2564339 [Mycena olivaceomarginata]